MRRKQWLGGALTALVLLCQTGVGRGADDVFGLKEGAVELKSAGPLAFGPQGILFVGDTKAATVYAIDTGDKSGEPAKVKLNIEGFSEKLGEMLGAAASEIQVNEMIVNPLSGNVYLSLSVGAAKAPGLIRIDATGRLSAVPLDKARFAKVTLPNPPEDKVVGEGPRAANRRLESITDLAYLEGRVIVSGLSADKASSTVRSLTFPFSDADVGTNVEIYHGAHGRVEDNAAIRAFVPFTINGEPNLLAGFTCTPLVKFPLNGLAPGKKVRGTTVAELGNRNRPLDMIVYKKSGKDFLLIANSARGVMKVSTDDIERDAGITSPVTDGKTAGQKYETISELTGVIHLDKLNEDSALILVQSKPGHLDLKTVALP